MIKCRKILLYLDIVNANSWTVPDTSWCQKFQLVCLCAHPYHSCLAQPETQLLALIDFSDREDFPVQGHKPSNRLRSLLAGKEVPSPWSNATFQPAYWQAGCEMRFRVQGKGLAAPAREVFCSEKKSNCTRHLQTLGSWQLSTPFLGALWEQCIFHKRWNHAGSTNQGFSKINSYSILWIATLCLFQMQILLSNLQLKHRKKTSSIHTIY